MNDWFDAERRAERAQQLSEARRWEEALAELDAALEVNPTNPSWLGQRGFLLDQLEDYEAAITAYREALEIDSEDRELLLLLAIDLARVGHLSAALTRFERLNELYPDFEPGYCYQISTYAELGQHDKAEEVFYIAQQLNEDCPQCYFHIALSLLERGEFQRALYCWERVLKIDSGFEKVQGLIARTYRGMSDFGRAEKYYLAAIREDPGDVDLLYEMGDLLEDAGDLDGASTKFRQVIELVPDHIDAHFALGRMALLADDAESAIDLLERVRRFDPHYSGLELHYGAACLKMGRYQEARGHLERATADQPANTETFMLLGNCLLGLHKPAAASDRFRRALAIDATIPNAHHNLGICCFLMGEHEQGIEHCRRAIELKPDYRMAIVKTVLAYQRLGRFGEARAMIDQGLHVDADDALLIQLRERLWRVRVRYFFGRVVSFFAHLVGKSPPE